jgi:hypothetical protein
MRPKAILPAELTRTIKVKVFLLLRKQAGFGRQITLAVPGGAEAVGIDLWGKREYAETCNRETQPQSQKPLEKFFEGPPAIQTYKVVKSTFHPMAGQTEASSSAEGVR